MPAPYFIITLTTDTPPAILVPLYYSQTLRDVGSGAGPTKRY